MYRIFFFGLGVLMTSWGVVFNIIYLSLFDLGYSFMEYWDYITGRPEVYLFPLGFIIINLVLLWPSKNNTLFNP